MDKLPYPTRQEHHAHMKMRQNQNRVSCLKSAAEAEVYERLKKETNIKWTRQAQWGYRLYDFWNATYGIAIEVDGKEHKKEDDRKKDEYNFRRSGIVVLRVPNFDKDCMDLCLLTIKKLISKETWEERRKSLGCSKKSPMLSYPDERNCLNEYLSLL
jgi:very-short-patch-repair endonuclease